MNFLTKQINLILSLSLMVCVSAAYATTNKAKSTMAANNIHVSTWNQFAEDLYLFHQHQIRHREIRTEEEYGGYVGMPDFYREIRYYDKSTGLLLSSIQWERENPNQIHVIEVYVYDQQGQLKSDYLAAFLPGHRNAPIQTLINVHYQNDELHSFRQFDVTGDKIYERCEGKHFNEPVMISLEEDDFDSDDTHIIKTLASEAYLSCFEFTPSVATSYFSPFTASGKIKPNTVDKQQDMNSGMVDADELQKNINQLTGEIVKSIKPGELYVQRGKQYFALHEFELAVNDYNKALELDDKLDAAYFGLGMAKGRMGLVKQGIEDLTIFINRNPNNSVAYTKRGVRYIWSGELDNAKKDLSKAIELDPKNAEAHDDLGVVNASKGNYDQAVWHFQNVIRIDPSYQKGFHNLAMAYHITGKKKAALGNINKALKISPNDKNSLLLKGEILNSLDMKQEAAVITERAEFLPDGNWSEQFSIQ